MKPDTITPFAHFEGSWEDVFRQLADIWREETAHHSSMNLIYSHWACQRIIGMGMQVVPLILEELKKGPDHWDGPLSAITGENPVLKSSYGKMVEIANAWIEWGKANGY